MGLEQGMQPGKQVEELAGGGNLQAEAASQVAALEGPGSPERVHRMTACGSETASSSIYTSPSGPAAAQAW
jgi:hypothetical protein